MFGIVTEVTVILSVQFIIPILLIVIIIVIVIIIIIIKLPDVGRQIR